MARASWFLFTRTKPENECGEGWMTVTKPGPDDYWHDEIPHDGRPTPFFPVTLDFGKISRGPLTPNDFQTNHVGYWINHVPIHGIPCWREGDPLCPDFLQWLANDYLSHLAVIGPETEVLGCVVGQGHVLIPMNFKKGQVFAAIEIVNPYTCILHGFVWAWDLEHRIGDNSIEVGAAWALFPLEDVEKW